MPDSDADFVSKEFQQDCVVAGGVEWQCRPTGTPVPAAFTRKVHGVSIRGNPLRIELNTSDCEPFEAFENQDIDIWSEDVVTASDLRAHRPSVGARTGSHDKSSTPESSAPESSTRVDLIDMDVGESATEPIVDEIILLHTTNIKISLAYEMNFHLAFRFKLRAGFNYYLAPMLFEFESWVKEETTIMSKVTAQCQSTYSSTLRKSRKFPLFAFPLSIAGIGLEIGFFGELSTETRISMDGKFQGEIGIMMSRDGKYGGKWDPDSAEMRPINDYSGIQTEKIFEWGGKVVAVVKPSIELKTSMDLGLSLSVLGKLGFRLSSSLKFELEAKFKYGLGNLILLPITTSQIEGFRFVIGRQDCLERHEGEVSVEARIRWLGVTLSFNPFGTWNMVSQRDLLSPLQLLIACSASGGVEGETLDYERIGGGSSGASYTDMYNSYQPPAPAPSTPSTCTAGIDCPGQPSPCAQGYTGTIIGAPCVSGCAIGYGEVTCQSPMCCKANSQSPPNNGQHSEIGSGVWQSTQLTVRGAAYVEVKCNAGYELSGRNLGFQGLGTRDNGYSYTLGTSGNNPINFRDFDWPSSSDHTSCVQVGTRRLSPSTLEAIPRRAHQDNGLTSEIFSLRDNSCQYANDGTCDEPQHCNRGTDSGDCSTQGDTCQWAGDEVCDEPQHCSYGTDWSDCSPGSGGGGSGSSGSGSESRRSGDTSWNTALSDCRFQQAIPGDGSWQLEERTCNPISCGSYPPVLYGTIMPTGERTMAQTVTISCNAGFTLTGDDRFSATPTC